MRLIDAEALYKDMQKRLELKPSARGTMYEFMQFVALDCVETAPTIEAKPVVHAHWVEQIIDGGQELMCSNCGEYALMNGEFYSDFSKYCPYCGAQMDEVVE